MDRAGDTYENEIEDMLQKTAAMLPKLEGTEWFLQQVKDRLLRLHRNGKDKEKVAVLGTSLPDEIFLAFGISPIRLLGGSRKMTEVSDGDLPRDADAVTRAAYGMLADIGDDRTLTVIPLVNDNSRKVAYLLKHEGKNVYTVTVPPVKNTDTLEEWKHQLELLIEKLSAHTGRHYTEKKLKKAGKATAEAKKQLRIFELLADKRRADISGIYRVFLPFCFYYAEDYEVWARHLLELNKRIAGIREDKEAGTSEVLLMGSPVYFPNYKIPFLLQEAGVSFNGNFIVPDIVKPYDGTKGFEDLCRKSFANDNSSAYVRNSTLYVRVSAYLKSHPVKGVVYHVLKGQIEYDFELGRLEKLFSEYGIPVIRLETDYSNQDVEQLRLRIEAFSEMLRGGTG